LLVVRSDTDKALPGKQRQHLRRASWATTLLCASVALWDIMLHPVQEGLFEVPDDVDDGLPDLWDQNTMLMLRWRQSASPGETELLTGAAEALEVESDELKTQVFMPDHRLLLFKVTGKQNSTRLPAHLRWKAALLAPKGKLGKVADTDFPFSLNVTLCLHAHASVELTKQKATSGEEETNKEEPQPELPADFVKIVGSAPGANAAYLAGCDWWTQTLDSFYHVHDDEAHDDVINDDVTAGDKSEDSSEGSDLA